MSKAIAKRIQIRLFAPGNQKSNCIHLHAGPRKAFTREGIEAILENCANDLEQKFPGEEYRLVELAKDSFNFVWVESKTIPDCDMVAEGAGA